MAIPVGTMLKGQYRIDALIGGGGMATVYRAYDTNLQKVCAIKQNMDTSPEAMRQFHLEAILLAGLNHPHLARVTDHFVDSTGQQYLVMDFVEGENLESYVARNGPVPETKALAWMAGVLDAVAYCHSQGVIHRDIKPANLVKRSGRDTVVLVDFGIAKQQLGGMTLAGARAATPAYAPLEQFTGHTDARSDVYALGATLYYLLTGVEPPDSRLAASGVESVAPLRSLNPQVSVRTGQAVQKAMALRVGDRPQSVAALGTALTGQQSFDTKPVRRPNQKRPARASQAALLAGALLTVVAVSTLAFFQFTDRPSPPPQPIAVISAATSSPAPSVISEPTGAGLTPLPAPEPSATPTTNIVTPTSDATDTPVFATKTPTMPPTDTPIPPTATPTSRPTNTPSPTRPRAMPLPTRPQGSTSPVLAPVLQSPPNGSEQRSEVIALQWSHGGLQTGQQYRVDLRTDYNQPVKTLTLFSQGTSLPVRFDQHDQFFKDDNTTFFWSVGVINAGGNVFSGRSDEWRFVWKRDTPQQQTPEPQTPEPQTPEPQTPEPPTPEPPTAEPPTPEPPTPEPSTPTPRSQ